MFSELDAQALLDALPVGISPDADPTAIATGRLTGLDPERGLAQVSVAGSDGVWMPAMPAIYTTSGRVRVLRSPLDGGRASLCLGPIEGASSIAQGKVISVNAAAGTLKVRVLDSDVDLPYLPGTYAVDTTVHVMRSASRYGLPEVVLGPAGNSTQTGPSQPGSGSSGGRELVTRRAVILPTWSGSYSTRYSRWDTWNTNRYGGRSTLWQGDGFGSGVMRGLAVYGDQIKNLNAVSIDSISVAVYRADSSSSGGRVPVLQPAVDGWPSNAAPTLAPAPAASGPALASGDGAQVMLPAAVLDGFRTGAYRGLVTVGSDYAGFNGTPDRAPVRADGMALTVIYKVAG